MSLCAFTKTACAYNTLTITTPKQEARYRRQLYLGASHDGDLLAISRASPATASATWRDVLNYNIGDAKTLVFRGEIRPHEHC